MRKPSDSSFQRSLAPTVWAVLVLATGGAPARAADGPAAFAVPKEVLAVLAAHCADCHGDRGKGNADVTALDKLKPGDRLETLNKIQDQLFYKMMPPPSADQPGEKDTRVLGEWVRAELRRHKASKLDDRLPYPDAGNYVDHVALFDGSNTDNPFTPRPPLAGQPADLRGARARRVPTGGPRPGPVAALRLPRRDHRLTLSPPSAFVKSP